jgi:hypothetical protein
MLRRCLLISLFLLPPAVKAQIISVDQVDTSSYVHKTAFNLNASLGAEIDKQKYTLIDASNMVDAALQHYRELFIFSGSERATYDEQQNLLNTGYLHLRYRHNYKNKIHPEAFAQYQWDEKIGMLRRSVAGVNIRYNFFRQDKLELTIGTGLMYEAEEWDYDAVDSSDIPANAVDPVTHLVKSNTYFKCDWKISSNTRIVAAVFLQERIDALVRYPRISQLLHWYVDVGRHVDLDIGYNGMYDSRPTVPISRYYYSVITSLLFHM